MSRNEIFMLLACIFTAAIMMAGPAPTRSPPVTFASLVSSDDGAAVADATMLLHSFDHQ